MQLHKHDPQQQYCAILEMHTHAPALYSLCYPFSYIKPFFQLSSRVTRKTDLQVCPCEYDNSLNIEMFIIFRFRTRACLLAYSMEKCPDGVERLQTASHVSLFKPLRVTASWRRCTTHYTLVSSWWPRSTDSMRPEAQCFMLPFIATSTLPRTCHSPCAS